MGHAYVPSKNDLRSSTIENLVKKVEDHKIYDEAHKVLDRLREDIDEEQMAYKLISMLLDQQDIKGPNQIGIPADKMDAILARAAQRGGQSRGRGGSRGRSGGGGGGYRGNKPRSGGSSDRNRDGGGSRDGGGYRGNRDKNRSSSGSRHRD